MSVFGMNLYAAEKTRCNEVIEACDKAIAAQKEEIKIREEESNLLRERGDTLQVQVEEKDKQLNNKLRKPGVLVGAGVLLTVVGGPIAGGIATLLATLIF